MQFKHPAILYFLFLLVIPIIVHLFQLRRFKKEYFTNVRFLKELSIQTRKSSVIKKWLLLATRLLLLACLIIAFAQPYFEAKDSTSKSNELVILLDNSFSMQAKGSKGELMRRAVQDLLENIPAEQQFSLLTPTESFWDTDIRSVQKDLQNLKYSAVAFRPGLLMEQARAHNPHTAKDVVVITDAVHLDAKDLNGLDPKLPTYFIIPEAENRSNISVDSVYISQVMDNFYEIKAGLHNYGGAGEDISVALYNGPRLTAKTLLKFKSDKETVAFTIPKKDFNGYISLSDNSLGYDNNYYFSISSPKKASVIAIGEAAKNEFLTRIYTPDEFDFSQSELRALNYNSLEKQDAIILNEIKDIPQSLITTLKAFYRKGGNIIVIPAQEANTANLNGLTGALGGPAFSGPAATRRQIVKIAFSHPLYRTVFEKATSNFQYPKTEAGFTIAGSGLPVLTYDDQTPFLSSATNKLGNLYTFAAALNKGNSNFQNSPLIVPTFYNMALNNAKSGITAFTIGENQGMVLNAALAKDEVITVKNATSDFIPMQQLLDNKVKISFGDLPVEAGNYSVFRKDEKLADAGFNYARNESNPASVNKSVLSDYTTAGSIDTVLSDIKSQRTADELWKWFLIGTLIFLITELLIQKFVK